jgi:hypothetical protein
MSRLSLRISFWALLMLAFSAQACSTYHYFDLDLQLDPGFNTVRIGQIEICHMFVTGAVTDDFVIDPGRCKTTDPATRNVGNIEYSTFADSGNVTFTFRIFQDPESNPLCELGHGSQTLAVSPRTTGTVTAAYIGPGCKP